MAVRINGDLKAWHKTTIDFISDTIFRESAATFRDHRLDVTFENAKTGETVRVPGYFAADGDAADSGATAGTVWRVNFTPPSEGEWTFKASFRTGKDIAASTDPRAGASAGAIDGASGSFRIAPTDKTGDDFRAKGMILQDEGTPYLQHQGDGDYFVRGGPGSPENLLAFKDFDNTPATLDYAAHAGDFESGGPTWAGGRGKNLIGAIDYLADHGQNTLYFMTLTAGGDGKDVWPWAAPGLGSLAPDVRGLDPAISSVYDVSKLAQWEIVLDHMDAKGIYKNLVLQERENDQLLDGGTAVAGSSLSVERMVYLREMVARFGHNNGIQWNLGEENSNSRTQRIDMTEYLEAVDPWDHPVVLHTWRSDYKADYDGMLGVEAFDGTSFHSDSDTIRSKFAQYRDASARAGDPWMLGWDEDPTDRSINEPFSNDPDSSRESGQRAALWGTLTVGGSGVNWYVKGEGGHVYDRVLDYFDGHESLWKWTAAAASFFNDRIPFWTMSEHDELTLNGGDYVMAHPGSYYVSYLPYGKAGDVRLDLSGEGGKTFDVFWYDPRNGGDLIAAGEIAGGGIRQIGGAPSATGKDWVVLVRDSGLPEGPDGGGDPVDPSDPPPSSGIDVWLIDAASDKRILKIDDGAVIDPAGIVSGEYSLEAVPGGNAQSVRFKIGGVTQVENSAPYALFGNKGGNFDGTDLPSGPQSVTIETFSGKNATGTRIATESIDFSFGSSGSGQGDGVYDLVVSAARSRSGAVDLEDATLSGDAFVFVAGAEDARKVSFWLDDTGATGAADQVENTSWHDFAGTAADGRAQAWDTTDLSEGHHSITAEIIAADGSRHLISDSFVIDNV
jgi:hypothetical protein